jgi:alpha-galactosidase
LYIADLYLSFERFRILTSPIVFDSAQRSFTMLLKSSFYSFRILASGELVHVGSGPLPAHLQRGEDPHFPGFTGFNSYEESNFVWDQQVRKWELPTFGDISYHDSAVKLSFQNPTAPDRPIRDLRLRYVDHEILTESAPGLSAASSNRSTRETLAIRLRDIEYDFDVVLNYRVTPEYDIIERWIELRNQTSVDVVIESLAFGTLHVPNGRYELTRVAGLWAGEFRWVRQTLEQGRTLLESLGLNTGHSANPFFLLNEEGGASEDLGAVYFGALAYSGNWSLRFEAMPTGAVRVHGGFEPSDFSLTLRHGESFTTPAFVHGCSANGYGGASRRLHAFAREYILPTPRHEQYRPVLYNSWEAVYFDVTLEGQLELARKAAAIGVELFVIDDGWFGGRRNDHAGLGDWHVSPDVLPGGLTPLIDEVKALGMRFGLWVEPEMVNPDSDLYRAHPDWVLHFDNRPRTEIRNQLILDFGRPEVVEHIFSQLDRLFGEHDITFVKWDMNRYATEPGSTAGKGIWIKHVAGVYSIMDRLRAAHPRLEIQSCSGGGGRIDLGILGRVEQAWTSDNTDAYDRVRIQDGYSLAYPLRAMECWVTHEKNHQSGRIASLNLRFDVAMRGALGIGTSLNQLSDEELEAYARKIAFYKQIRPIVQGGDLYRLATQPDISTWLIVAPDKTRAVYSNIVTNQLLGTHRAPAKLPGLIPDLLYNGYDENGTQVGQWSGLQLATLGIPGDMRDGGGGCLIRSRTILLEAKG